MFMVKNQKFSLIIVIFSGNNLKNESKQEVWQTDIIHLVNLSLIQGLFVFGNKRESIRLPTFNRPKIALFSSIWQICFIFYTELLFHDEYST